MSRIYWRHIHETVKVLVILSFENATLSLGFTSDGFEQEVASKSQCPNNFINRFWNDAKKSVINCMPLEQTLADL